MDARLYSQTTDSGHTGPRDDQRTQAQEVRPRTVAPRAQVYSPFLGAVSSSTGIDETSHGQRESVTSHSKSAVAHGSVNGPWSESAIPQTNSGVRDTLHENLNPKRKIDGKSESGILTRKSVPAGQHTSDLAGRQTPLGPGRISQLVNTQMSWPAGRHYRALGKSPSHSTR